MLHYFTISVRCSCGRGRKEREGVSIHPNGSQDLLDEQRWRERTFIAMAVDHQEHWEERETKTLSSTNPETKRQPTATRGDLAPDSLGSLIQLNAHLTHRRRPHQRSGDLRPPSDERRPHPQEHRTCPLANWLFKNSNQADIVDLHSCPDGDCSMAIETVGFKFSLLKDNVRVGVAQSI